MDECRLGSVLTSGSVFWVRGANERKSNKSIELILLVPKIIFFVYRPSKICSNQRVTFKIDCGAEDRKILTSRKILCASVYKHFVIYAAHPGGDGLFMNSTVGFYCVPPKCQTLFHKASGSACFHHHHHAFIQHHPILFGHVIKMYIYILLVMNARFAASHTLFTVN